jgi:predicted nucleotidyltransferase
MDNGIKREVLEQIITLAKECKIEKIILFGSRARGDFKQASDIDLAVSGGDVARFTADIEEKVSTLLFFDIVDLGASVQQALLDSITQEGKILYEKI